ncbi:SUKH-4 family immunity protein [Streptomyces krungchingensis]|uniref:SUKH-4 family immunity protein n=1 Tax=Streptomyces krungchingensis TaxID=1565034 RepID=UPI003CFBAAA9
MSPLVGREAMESVYGSGELVTLDESALTPVGHEPTRAFLRDVGLPSWMGWFQMDRRLEEGDIRVGGEAWRNVARRYPSCTSDMSSWLALGGIALDDVAVDTVTGVVHCIPENGSPHRLNSGVDELAFFLLALERERPQYDPESDTVEVDPEGAAERLLRLMRDAEPGVMENPDCCWFSVLGHVRDLLQV